MADRTQHEGKTERAKESHDRCSQPPGMRMPKTADLGTQALLVVNSFKLSSRSSALRYGLPSCMSVKTTQGAGAVLEEAIIIPDARPLGTFENHDSRDGKTQYI